MIRRAALLLSAVLLSAAFLQTRLVAQSAGGAAMLSHDVFFSLKDSSESARARLVEACRKYLKGHPGEVFFATGTRVQEHVRDVNDRNFDVSLHIVFRSKADHDRYQSADRHKKFIEENQSGWAAVRVFDSWIK